MKHSRMMGLINVVLLMLVLALPTSWMVGIRPSRVSVQSDADKLASRPDPVESALGGNVEVEHESQEIGVGDLASFNELSPEERLERARRESERYFNPERMGEKGYREKVRRHSAIAAFLTATRRNDPDYMEVMSLLLSRGYGISEWREVCSRILDWQQPIHAYRKHFGEQGLSYQAVEDKVAEYTENHRSVYEKSCEQFVRILGVSDQEFFDQLMAVPLDANNREDVVGQPPGRLAVGDEFLGDEDWLTPEWKREMEDYEGPDRREWTPRLRDAYAYFRRRKEIRSLGLAVPEPAGSAQELLLAGLISEKDLVGIEMSPSGVPAPAMPLQSGEQ